MQLRPENAILGGKAPDGLTVAGELFFYNEKTLKRLPDDLQVDETGPQRVPAVDRVASRAAPRHSLTLRTAQIAELPADLQVSSELRLLGCTLLAFAASQALTANAKHSEHAVAQSASGRPARHIHP